MKSINLPSGQYQRGTLRGCVAPATYRADRTVAPAGRGYHRRPVTPKES